MPACNCFESVFLLFFLCFFFVTGFSLVFPWFVFDFPWKNKRIQALGKVYVFPTQKFECEALSEAQNMCRT